MKDQERAKERAKKESNSRDRSFLPSSSESQFSSALFVGGSVGRAVGGSVSRCDGRSVGQSVGGLVGWLTCPGIEQCMFFSHMIEFSQTKINLAERIKLTCLFAVVSSWGRKKRQNCHCRAENRKFAIFSRKMGILHSNFL